MIALIAKKTALLRAITPSQKINALILSKSYILPVTTPTSAYVNECILQPLSIYRPYRYLYNYQCLLSNQVHNLHKKYAKRTLSIYKKNKYACRKLDINILYKYSLK